MPEIPAFFGKSLASLLIMGLRVVMMAAKFALAIFLARFMGLEVLGLYGLLASAVSVLPVILRAGIINVFGRDAVTQSPEALARNLVHYYIALAGAYTLCGAALAGVCLLTGYWLLPWLVFALVVLEHVVGDWFSLLVSTRRAVRANLMLFAQAGGWMLAFMICAWFLPELRNVPVLLLFWAGGGVLAILSTFSAWRGLPLRSTLGQGISKGWYREHWKKSRFFYLSDIAYAGGIHIDRYLVGIVLGLELTGVYVLFWQMANAVHTLVLTGVIQLCRPRLIEAHAREGFDAFRALYRKCMKSIAFSVLGLSLSVAAIAPLVTGWTDRPLALSYIPLLWVMLCAMCLRALADGAGSGLLARYMDKALIGSNLMQVCGTALFVLAGLHLSGIYGAALGIALVHALTLAVRQYALKRLD